MSKGVRRQSGPKRPPWLRFEDQPDTPFDPLIVELSYAFGREHQRRGYAAEACAALLTYGSIKKRLARLTNKVDSTSERSWRLCERLGFGRTRNLHREATGPVWVLDNGRLGGDRPGRRLGPPGFPTAKRGLGRVEKR